MSKVVLFLFSLAILLGVASTVVLYSEASGDKVRGDEGQGEVTLNCLHEGVEDLSAGCVYEVRP